MYRWLICRERDLSLTSYLYLLITSKKSMGILLGWYIPTEEPSLDGILEFLGNKGVDVSKKTLYRPESN